MIMARVFQPIPRILTRTFSVPVKALWRRFDNEGGYLEDEIQVLFNSSAEVMDADGLSMISGVPIATCTIADALKIEPSRAGNENEIFHNDGRDEIEIDGITYDVESCKASGYGMIEIKLKRS